MSRSPSCTRCREPVSTALLLRIGSCSCRGGNRCSLEWVPFCLRRPRHGRKLHELPLPPKPKPHLKGISQPPFRGRGEGGTEREPASKCMQRRSMEAVAVPVVTAPSAPCSPRTAAADHLPAGYCYFFSSAPTSPSRGASGGDDASPGDDDGSTFDFTMGFGSGHQLQDATPVLAAADELFEGGRIRPLNAPHPSVLMVDDECASSSSSCSFPARSSGRAGGEDQAAEASARGRPAAPASAAASARSRRATRSLSPFRGGGGGGDEDESSPSSPPSPRASMMRGCGSGSKKWRLKDFFPFHSASDEGRGGAGSISKDRLFKYAVLPSSSHPAAQKQLTTSVDGTTASMRKGRGQSTASEQDVTRRRTTTTTPLPLHRNSLFGYLRSNPAIHSISRKLGNHPPSSTSTSTSNRGRRSAARPTSATHASTTTTTCPD